ncbi:hypothetical protein [Rhizobium lusitanum]|uniref:hypothetical protein n=1 Tax=Rhizobium lusitanum TaxID=293958 RepID=UPI001956F343|nr:hypothetical protein [Rhizobium lusitanum]MBM7043604.1 hypothetical protein [Rhizobium lusitanum]
MRPHPPEKAFNILSAFASDRGAQEEDRTARTNTVRRSKLARVLVALAESSGLQKQTSVATSISEQFNLVAKQAEKYKLAGDVPLKPMLCKYPPKLTEFLRDFDENARRFTWPKGSREHGILLLKALCVENGSLVFSNQVRVPVAGPIAIFGRDDAPRRKDRPYLAIGLIAKQSQSSPPEVIRAYVHPCYSHDNLMLVDSNYERETFKYLSTIQAEYSGRLDFEIEKPLSDVGKRFEQAEDAIPERDNQEIEARGAPPILIPDFILRFGKGDQHAGDFFVETMGFRSSIYRAVKRRVVPEMAQALGGLEWVEHDFHFPRDKTPQQRHENFRTDVRSKLADLMRKRSIR